MDNAAMGTPNLPTHPLAVATDPVHDDPIIIMMMDVGMRMAHRIMSCMMTSIMGAEMNAKHFCSDSVGFIRVRMVFVLNEPNAVVNQIYALMIVFLIKRLPSPSPSLMP